MNNFSLKLFMQFGGVFVYLTILFNFDNQKPHYIKRKVRFVVKLYSKLFIL